MTKPDHLALDPDALKRLEEWGGMDLVGQIIDLFIQHAPERMEQIRSGAEAENLDAVERGAHSLKSSSGNVGAGTVFRLAGTLEERAESGDLDGIRQLLPELEDAFDEATAALREVRKELSP